jgi:hypothetical protein
MYLAPRIVEEGLMSSDPDASLELLKKIRHWRDRREGIGGTDGVTPVASIRGYSVCPFKPCPFKPVPASLLSLQASFKPVPSSPFKPIGKTSWAS